MRSGQQVIRWSIPGLLFFAHLLVMSILIRVLGLNENAGAVVKDYAKGTDVVVALLASGIPVGFLIYQIYYLGYGPFLLPRLGLMWIRGDRGAWFLNGLERPQLDALERQLGVHLETAAVDRPARGPARLLRIRRLVGRNEKSDDGHAGRSVPYPLKEPDGSSVRWTRIESESHSDSDWNTKVRAYYTERFFSNLRVSQYLLDEIQRIEPGNNIKSEYVAKSDLYHGLGAGRFAIFLAAVTHVATLPVRMFIAEPERSKMWEGNNEWSMAGWSTVMVAVCVAHAMVLHQTRRQVWSNLCSGVQLGFRAFFTRHGPMVLSRPSQASPRTPR